MPVVFRKFFVVCLCLICIAGHSFAQSDQELIGAINNHLIPLNTLSPDADFSDLQKLKVILKDKPVIGIGEATHGTHEFFLFKHRMLEFLVKEMGVKTFVIEGDFAGTKAMNDFVVNGAGDAKKGLQGIGFGIWMTQEFTDMANWLKSYNDTQTPENKVRFFGCDMQWGSAAMQLIKDDLSVNNRFTSEMNVAFEAMKKFMPTLSGKEKSTIRAVVSGLSKAEFTNPDTALYHHHVRELQQYVEYMDAQSTLFPARQSDVRDKYMAENVEWIYEYTHHNRMMVWAHNAHIGKSSGSYGYHRMGEYLGDALKDKYYALGFDLSGGQVRAFDPKANQYKPFDVPASKPGSSGAILAQCSSPNFILDCKSAPENERIHDFLNKDISSLFIGADYASRAANPKQNYFTHKIAATFDGVIFIRETTPSMAIKYDGAN